jgi:hypothetical protein
MASPSLLANPVPPDDGRHHDVAIEIELRPEIGFDFAAVNNVADAHANVIAESKDSVEKHNATLKPVKSQLVETVAK